LRLTLIKAYKRKIGKKIKSVLVCKGINYGTGRLKIPVLEIARIENTSTNCKGGKCKYIINESIMGVATVAYTGISMEIKNASIINTKNNILICISLKLMLLLNYQLSCTLAYGNRSSLR
jgi:hypothetical protein